MLVSERYVQVRAWLLRHHTGIFVQETYIASCQSRHFCLSKIGSGSDSGLVNWP